MLANQKINRQRRTIKILVFILVILSYLLIIKSNEINYLEDDNQTQIMINNYQDAEIEKLNKEIISISNSKITDTIFIYKQPKIQKKNKTVIKDTISIKKDTL